MVSNDNGETGMTPEDRQVITAFFDRMRTLDTERDPAAEALIDELMRAHPQTRYYVTQLAVFLEQAQAESQNRIRELEHRLEGQGSGGLLGGLFGGGRSQPAPTPVHAPGYRPGMFGQQPGGGFLAGAAGTAMGVAGGMLLGSAIMSMLAPDALAETAPADPFAPEPGADAASFEDVGFDAEL